MPHHERKLFKCFSSRNLIFLSSGLMNHTVWFIAFLMWDYSIHSRRKTVGTDNNSVTERDGPQRIQPYWSVHFLFPCLILSMHIFLPETRDTIGIGFLSVFHRTDKNIEGLNYHKKTVSHHITTYGCKWSLILPEWLPCWYHLYRTLNDWSRGISFHVREAVYLRLSLVRLSFWMIGHLGHLEAIWGSWGTQPLHVYHHHEIVELWTLDKSIFCPWCFIS